MSKPKRPVTLKIRHATAKGATIITSSMMPMAMCARLWRKSSIGLACSFGNRVMATPTINAKKMMPSMLKSAAALTGLRGTMLTSRSMLTPPCATLMAAVDSVS